MAEDQLKDEARTDALQRLQRWELFGGHWRVISRTAGALEIGMFTCDGGEMVDRLRSDEAALSRYVGSRTSDEDG